MNALLRTLIFLLAATIVNSVFAETDPLRTALEESKASNKGLSFYVNGQAIAGVVVKIDDRFVVARSQAQGTIIIRLDRIDGVAGFVSLPGSESKAK